MLPPETVEAVRRIGDEVTAEFAAKGKKGVVKILDLREYLRPCKGNCRRRARRPSVMRQRRPVCLWRRSTAG